MSELIKEGEQVFKQLSKVEIWTDGSCDPNPGAGGWAFYVPLLDHKVMGHASFTTNNQMELFAVIAAVEWSTKFQPGVPLSVFSDSMYVINPCNNGSLEKRKHVSSKLINSVLWSRLSLAVDDLVAAGGVFNISWVKAHYYDRNNNAADRLADKACQQKLGENVSYICEVDTRRSQTTLNKEVFVPNANRLDVDKIVAPANLSGMSAKQLDALIVKRFNELFALKKAEIVKLARSKSTAPKPQTKRSTKTTRRKK